MVGARRFERVGSRKGHRNGTYLRRLLTSLGQIDVTVPRRGERDPEMHQTKKGNQWYFGMKAPGWTPNRVGAQLGDDGRQRGGRDAGVRAAAW